MATNRQALIPGWGYANETNPPNNGEAFIPGLVYLNHTVESAAAATERSIGFSSSVGISVSSSGGEVTFGSSQ